MAEATEKQVNTMEQAFKTALHGVETPKQINFLSRKLSHEYEQFKILTKRILSLLPDNFPEQRTVNKVLMWLGPDACEKLSLI